MPAPNGDDISRRLSSALPPRMALHCFGILSFRQILLLASLNQPNSIAGRISFPKQHIKLRSYKMWGLHPKGSESAWQEISFSLLFTSLYTYRQSNRHRYE
jgi:hypothetical protein